MSAAPASTMEKDPADSAGALDLILASAALGPLRRFAPGTETIRLARRLAGQPRRLALRSGDLLREYGRIGLGRSALVPPRGDRRFADPAWSGNPALRRIMQAYLVTSQTAEDLVTDAHLEWRDDQRVRFLVDNLVAAAAPSNNPVVNPLTWKALLDTGGASLIRGASNLASDMVSAPRVPAMVEPSAFEVGRSVGVSPGWVVLRTPVFELIQYTPQTEQVRAVPLLIVPPVINKYYVLDMAPGRSLIEYLVGQGQQVFVMSWRNPDARHRDWGLDVYGQAVVEAMEVTAQVCNSEQTHLLALCSGGIIAAMVASAPAGAPGSDRLATLGLGVTVLDQSRAGLAGALIDPKTARAALAASSRRGYLDGRNLAEVFAWLRPNDLVWNYWVNNYLQGQKPPPFDVLYWNSDTTRLTAALHRDFMELALANSLATPGGASLLGRPVDLSTVEVDSYVVAGIADHICPWQSCYATTQMLGGKSRFVLSTAGHIAALVNPPTNPKATFRTSGDNPADAGEWLRTASTENGSWWPDYARWLAERSGAQVPAPGSAGNSTFVAQEPAPVTYVFDR